MKKLDFLSTLFVGIDVSSKSNVVCALDFQSNKLLQFSVPNNQPGAEEFVTKLISILEGSRFKTVVLALESTSFYGIHIANFLSSSSLLMPYNPYVYCLNPKMIANYRKSFIGLSKTDPLDAFVIADFARVGRINIEPWHGSQYLALQRLTRHRLHLVECITREKTYMVSNIFLKFSELSILKNEAHPFTSNHTATASAILTEMLSLEDLVSMPIEELVDFVCKTSKNRFTDPAKVADILRQAARNSYRLDKCLYEPLTISIASSFNCVSAYQTEIKIIDKAIEKAIKGLNPLEYQCLISIPGIGPVYASGILAEIGTISAFHSHEALAMYAGIVWKQNQSGDFRADDTKMSKAGNKFLRYYLIEAANSVRNNIPEYRDFYLKKYLEVKTHQHKRALALTSRKLIRLIFGLLAKNQLYSSKRVNQTE
ncbi:MAG: IS110 family transposase [Peptostreptococcaceae bacterium]|nr:IS110 family transposase [Peptostreptococcaceae bacterium]